MRSSLFALLLAAGTLVTGCGGSDPAGDLPDPTSPPNVPAPTATRPGTPAPPPEARAEGARVSDAVWLRRVDAFCETTTGAVDRLFTASSGPADPVGALARLARDYRAGVEALARTNPPAARASLQALTLAEGRESASRLDVAVERARAKDFEAATRAAAELDGVLPELPADVVAKAPACKAGLSASPQG